MKNQLLQTIEYTYTVLSMLRLSAKRQVILSTIFVLGWSSAWIYLGQSEFYVGPSEWDDVFYVELSTSVTQHWSARNRYIHIWGLRLLTELFGIRTLAVSLAPTLTLAALIGLCFFLGRRMGGICCGLIAAGLTPFFQALLKWSSVPYVDPTVGLLAAMTLFVALMAVQSENERHKACLFFLVGFFLYLSLKTKETSLAVLPALVIVACTEMKQWRLAPFGLLGFGAGWLLLLGLDHRYAAPDWAWKSSDWFTFWGKDPQRMPGKALPHIERMSTNYLHLLTRKEYLPFFLLAILGVFAGFRRSLPVRAITGWLFFSLLLGSAAAWRSTGLFADERYLAAMAPAFVCLSAYGFLQVWNKARGPERSDMLWIFPIVLFMASVSLVALWRDFNNVSTIRSARAVFFMLPLTQLFLLSVPFLTRGRWVGRIAYIILLIMIPLSSVHESRVYIQSVRERMRPWYDLHAQLNTAGVGLARFSEASRPFPIYHIRRRINALSRNAHEDVTVRTVSNLEDVSTKEWIFTLGRRNRNLEKSNWIRVISGVGGPDNWSVYRPGS